MGHGVSDGRDIDPCCVQVIPHFITFVTSMTGISMEQFNTPPSGDALKEVFDKTPPLGNVTARQALDERFGSQMEYGEKDRLVRSRGGYYAYEIPTNTRLVDAIFFPESVADVEAVVQIAREHNLVLIPRGGGTNVSNMLEVPHKEEEPREIVSVDMTRMNKLLSLDRVNQVAEIQAGANGREVRASPAVRSAPSCWRRRRRCRRRLSS